MKLQGKRAVVTGASGGIGRAIAIGLASEGADVLISYRSNQDRAEKTVSEIEQLGRRGYAQGADFTQEGAEHGFIEAALSRLGGIDILVNNAGMVERTSFFDLEPRTFEEVLRVNLAVPLRLIQCAASWMISQGQPGHFINISSIAGRRCAANRTAYCCSKAGVDMLTKCAAVELAPHGIRVNGIAPGVTETGMAAESAKQDPNWLKRVSGRIATGRLGRAEDFVGVAIYLASDESDWMTGQVLVLDGGQTIRI